MKGLLKYLKGYEKECVLGPLFKLAEASFELAVPLVVARLIDKGIGNGNGGDIRIAAICCVILAALAIGGLAFAVIAQYFAAKAATGFGTKLRSALFAKIQSFSYTELDREGASALITRMTSDTNTLQNGVNMALRLFLRSPFIVFGAAILAFYRDSGSAVTFVVVIPALCLVVFGIMLASIPLYKKVQQYLEGVLGITRDNLSGARVIRAFCAEDREVNAFDAENRRLDAMQRFVGRLSALMNPVTYVIINGGITALIYIGGLKVNSGLITVGTVIAMYNYMSQILVELIKLANLIITMTRAAACGARVESVLATESSLASAGSKERFDGKVCFDGVSLCYAGSSANSLEKITFTANAGETVGVIGGTGSGKTSLVNLIPHFYDATEGTVAVDGKDVKEWDPAALRAKIGIVPQKADLFSGSVRENLLWGDVSGCADDGDLLETVKTAQALDVIESKNGLDTAVEQGGRNLSGGQKQRLTIARALVRHPEILILDDSASALDFATDAALRKAIKELPDSPLVFIVSQRASSVMHADKIIVLEDGAAVGIGTHDQLMDSCPEYREIYDSQFDKDDKSTGEAEK